MNLLDTILSTVAGLTSESTSWVGFYEPKVPEGLIKTEKEAK
jgi:cyclic lactone autoinducer peptide